MKLKDFVLRKGNHFVAMEYYNLILNRTFLCLLTDDYLIGLKVNGLVAVEGSGDPLTRTISKKLAITDDLKNPYSYMKSKFLRKIENLDIFGHEIIQASNSNFKINRTDILIVKYDSRKKWGMGYYPHDGRIYIKTINGEKKEFIILGSQSGREIVSWLK